MTGTGSEAGREDADSSSHLLECLTNEAHVVLFSTYGKEITGMTEVDLTSRLKRLIVRKCNATASTMKVLKMHQDSDQPILSCIAQIKAVARQCNFKVKCTCPTTVKCKCTDFTDHMVLYKLVEGLNDLELQEELLTEEELTL